ncbi:MAG: hypothetical protein FWE71_04305 [Nocardioidaceae bacterium]|nr:hypothetical protein [Nocardioidaceae bacterium]MCL2612986.1 hypothetical protein [Nocardioidaceae bacterium]
MPRRALLFLVTALGLLGSLSACGQARASVGHVYGATGENADLHHLTAKVPGTVIELTYGGFLAKARVGDSASSTPAVDAPSGGAILPFTLDAGPDSAAPLPVSRAATGRVHWTAAIRSAGHDTPIDVTGSAPKAVALAATGGAQLVVTFDGLSQVFDLPSGRRAPGGADPLYGSTPTRHEHCPKSPASSRGLLVFTDCSLTSTTVPWLGRWASAGREFVLLDVTVHRPEVERRGISYGTVSSTATVSVDGRSSQRVPVAKLDRWVVAEVPAASRHQAELTFRIRASHPIDPTAPPRASVTVTRVIPLG